MHRHLQEAAKLGQLSDGVSIDLAAHQLVAMIDGLTAERVLYPDRVKPDLQRKIIGQLLASFLA
jgi:hypothetical protein